MTDDRPIALITGAGSGLGLESALFLGVRNFRGYGTVLSEDEQRELEAQAALRNAQVTALRMDVTKRADIDRTVDAIIRAFCFTGREVDIYFTLRPFLPDPGDEFLLELAVAGRADAIVTHNVRHFPRIDRLGVGVVTPGEFLRTMKAEGI